MPKRLEEGESHTFYFPLDTLSESFADEEFKFTQVSVTDGTGKEWPGAIDTQFLDYIKNYSDKAKEESREQVK